MNLNFTGREPVVVISGIISAILVAMVSLGFEIPEGTEAALQAAVVAVAGLISAMKVRRPGQPTTIALGLFAAIGVFLAAFGVELSENITLGVQELIIGILALFNRQQVVPEEGPA